MPMPEKRFWELIDSTRETAEGDVDLQQDLLRKRLKRMSPESLIGYQETLERLVGALSNEDVVDAVRDYLPEMGGDDDFDDFSHWLVSRGEEVYNAVLASPKCIRKHLKKSRSKEVEFPTLWGNALNVYQEKTGKPMGPSRPPKAKGAAGHTAPLARSVVPPARGSRKLLVQWQVEVASDEETVSVHCIAVSPQANLVAAGGSNGRVRLWNLSGKFVRDLEMPDFDGNQEDGIRQIVIANRRLTAHSKQGLQHDIIVWSLRNGARVGEVSGLSYQTALSADGGLVVTVDPPGPFQVFDLGNQKVLHTLAGPREVWTFAATPDLSCVVGHGKKGFTVWDARSGKALRSFKANKKAEYLAISPDGRLLLGDTGHHDAAMLWDVATGKQIENRGGMERGKFSPDGQFVARVNLRDRTLDVWALANTERVQAFAVAEMQCSYAIYDIAQDNSLLALTPTGQLFHWETTSGRLKAQTRLPGGRGTCVFSADGETMFASDGRSLVCLR